MVNIQIDCEKVVGKIKPMHAVNNIPQIGNQWFMDFLKGADIPYGRLHDTGGAFGGNLYVDIDNIFRDFDADVEKEENYDFAFTDWLIKQMVDNGIQPFYRLGTSIENLAWIKPLRIFPPKDNLKWAKICEHIIRHYNHGWANGFHYGIEYWEIWNEPETASDGSESSMWRGTKEQYFELYETASNHLKSCFPEIKIGGYASCGFYHVLGGTPIADANVPPNAKLFVDYFHDFLKYITSKEHKSPLDFFSWHSYSNYQSNVGYAEYARKTLDEYGLTKTESILNEYNPLGRRNKGLLVDATNLAANMVALQQAPLDMLMYYEMNWKSAYCGLFDAATGMPLKALYDFFAFNELYKRKEEVKSVCEDKEIYFCAAKKGNEIACMAVNTSAEGKELTISFDGANIEKAKAITVKVIDEERTYELVDGNVTGNGLSVFAATNAIISIVLEF